MGGYARKDVEKTKKIAKKSKQCIRLTRLLLSTVRYLKSIWRHFGLRREQKKIVEGQKIRIDFLSCEKYNVDVEE